jgi:hypothetical protein
MGAIVQAASSATIRDDAGLFTSAGRSAIERAAEQNNVRVVVITNNQSFPSKSAWHAWLRDQATDPNAITIGLHVGRTRRTCTSCRVPIPVSLKVRLIRASSMPSARSTAPVRPRVSFK